MADTGAPGFIPLASGSDQFSPPQAPLNALATALNTALSKTAFNPYPTLAALNAAPGTVLDQHASVNADPTAANNGDYAWSGSAWIQTRIATQGRGSFAEASGVGSNAAGAYGAVTFPAGRFTVAPLVTLQILGSAVAFPLITSVTATGFSGGAFSSGGSAVAGSWNWHAIQMTSTAAAG